MPVDTTVVPRYTSHIRLNLLTGYMPLFLIMNSTGIGYPTSYVQLTGIWLERVVVLGKVTSLNSIS